MATAETSAVEANPPQEQQQREIPLLIRAHLSRQNGQWSAIAIDYSVVGVGDTPDLAARELLELVCDYLSSEIADGVHPHDARRPIPLGWRLRLRARGYRDRALHAVRRASAPGNYDVMLPRHDIGVC